MIELTKAEEQVMQYLWNLQQAFIKDLLQQFPEPKPAYNTVSTIVRILENKGFVAHTAFGKSHQYYPLVSKNEYRRFTTEKLVNRYFGGSPSKLLSYFIENKEIDTQNLDELLKLLKKSKH